MIRGTINIGIIGGGMISNSHINAFKAIRGVKVTWLCEIVPEALKAGQEKYGIPNGTADYREVLKDPDVTAVVICTPPFLHAKMAIDAMRAGKHVLLEKPLGPTPGDVRKVVAEAKKHPKLHILECSCRHSRLQPKFPFVKNLIDSGKLGEIYYIHHNALGRQGRPGVEYNPKAKWFLDRKLAGGGPLADWGVYDLSFLLGILGDKPQLKKVTALTRNRLDEAWRDVKVFDVEEHGVAMLEFDKGLKMYYERGSNAHNAAPCETRIYGTKGGLKLNYLTFGPPEVEYFYIDKNGRGKAKSKTFTVSYKKHPGEVQALDRHFINVLRGKEKPAMPVSLAAKHLDIIFKTFKASGI